jgi:hypothetical protein
MQSFAVVGNLRVGFGWRLGGSEEGSANGAGILTGSDDGSAATTNAGAGSWSRGCFPNEQVIRKTVLGS